MKAIIVGAGLAGLVAANRLAQANVDVLVLEASDGPGGRVRSDKVDGFILDRGFQVLFDCYPAAARNLDLDALELMAFDPGAVICRDGKIMPLTDPFRDRKDALAAAVSTAVSPADKLRVLQLSNELRAAPAGIDASFDDRSALDYLRDCGFGSDAIDNFFVPFFGGIFLDRSLSTSAAVFRYYFQMLSIGRAVVPSGGMGMIARQLASKLPSNSLRLNASVKEVVRSGDVATGVRLDNGEEIAGDAVIIATDAPTASTLANTSVPEGALGSTTLYFVGEKMITSRRKILLNAETDAFVNNVQPMNNVSRDYAPEGRYLIGATVLGVPDLDDDALAARALADIARMVEGDRESTRALAGCRLLRIYRLPYSQFPQPAGTLSRRPSSPKVSSGLFVTGEWAQYSSIDGAMLSGEQCAEAVIASSTSDV